MLTAALFTAGKYVIGMYIDHVSVGGAYGPAGAIVVLLTWVYYASIIVLLGAELTRGLAVARVTYNHAPARSGSARGWARQESRATHNQCRPSASPEPGPVRRSSPSLLSWTRRHAPNPHVERM
ncbi:YhjD/YihY/BrkB family envelope integrity protein [Luteibacter sp.]|uniref:YhjD/YihY/BrkB family envelope integrity protein n=1 Tax=Luteibacter sp. TaxID=1886636 RepID=UPI0025C5BFFD|nr:YhjD/YihY/BrkB family envelope integrity protein [Luteibacter sp.]